MDDSKNDLNISFFKPANEHARANRNMVLWLVAVWAIAIFGFQLALYVFQKPTPEPSYVKFENSWQQVKNNAATEAQLQDFSYATLSVLGKVFIDVEHKTALDNALSWTVFQLLDANDSEALMDELIHFEELAGTVTDIQDDAYLQSKEKIIKKLTKVLGLGQLDVRSRIIPLELQSSSTEVFTDENKELVEEAMSKYLIHYQSALTDTKFLGFPFHYFYTAIFLLILFVGLCLVYCIRTDRINAKYNIAD